MKHRITLLLIQLAICIATAVALSSCRSHRQAVTYTPAPDAQVISMGNGWQSEYNAAAAQAGEAQQQPLALPSAEWTDVQLPFSLSVTLPKNMQVSGRALFVKGEGISLSIRVMGMEVATACIDAEQVVVVDKFHGRAYTDSLSALLAGHRLPIADVQSLLIGIPFEPQPIRGLELMCQLTQEGTLSTLSALMEGADAFVAYADPVETPHGLFAPGLEIEAARYGLPIANAEIIWSWGQARWNSGKAISKKIPSGYDVMPLSSLIKQK